MFLRNPEFYLNRFHDFQEQAWLAYKAGLDLVLACGRRSGKSELICQLFVEDIEDHGKDCLYIALTQTQAKEIMWPKFRDLLGGDKRWKFNEARLEIKHRPTQAIIGLKGADLGKDRLRGNAKRLIALDEFAFFKDPTIVKDVLAPQLSDYNGQFIYCSTPKGKNHFWQLKNKALADTKNEKFWTAHWTMFENPFINEEGRKKLLAEYTGTDDPLYRQEVLGEYIDFQGLVFALPQDSYTERVWDRADFDFSFHYRGMDHGFSPDPTACVWVAYNERKGHFQVYNEYKKSELLIHQHTKAIQSLETFRFLETFSDVDPQLIAEYEAAGLKGIVPAQKHDKESKLLMLVNWLKTGKLKIANHCTQLLDEMQVYEWDQDGNDHLIDALRYAMTNIVLPVLPEKPPEETRVHHRDYLDGHHQSFDE